MGLSFQQLEMVTKTTRDSVLNDFDVDSCVATTRILIDVLKYFGVNCVPLPVEVTIFNQTAFNIIETRGLKALAVALKQQNVSDVGGPWSVGIGMSSQENTPGAGHVIVGIPAANILIDGSLDQGARPRKNIHLEPIVTTLSDGEFFLQPNAMIALQLRQNSFTDVHVTYKRTRKRLYLQSPNWSGTANGSKEPFRRLTSELINRLKQDLS